MAEPGLTPEARAQLLLARLRTFSASIRANNAELDDLYAQRLAVYQELRELDPPVTHAAIARAAGVTEDAVAQALRKARLASASS